MQTVTTNQTPSEKRTSRQRRALTLLVLATLLALAAIAFVRLPVTHAASAQMLGSVTSPAVLAPSVNKNMAGPNDCGLVWRVKPASNGGTAQNILYGVQAIADNDVWAVGTYTELIGGVVHFRAMAQHWDGTTWSLVTIPQPGEQSNLFAISAVSSNDIWAVGDYMPDSTNWLTFILHWDGSTWTQVPSPNVGVSYNPLTAVAAVAQDAVWAVGFAATGTSDETTVLYWDGSNWAIVPSPSPDVYDVLQGVTATSADDMWAVGWYRSGTTEYARNLIIHCTRSQCTGVAAPNSGAGDNRLAGVSALSSTAVWAVGYSVVITSPQTSVPLALRWNGQGWSTLPTPPIPSGTDGNGFASVISVSTGEVWAVGSAYSSSTRHAQTLAALWNGSSWTASTPLNMGPDNSFAAVDALSVADVWAVGQYGDYTTNAFQTLAEHYNDPCVTPSPTPTNVPNPSPTSTPPTSCSIQFTDAPVGSTFYSFVHCLACQNILGGYSTGCSTGNPCFKPGNPVTRGQLAKIVSNSAGYNDQHSNQIFQDVPVGSTFYAFVERLASRSIIGGYACGGAGEPCVPPANLSYFRPNAQVTRGQTSKIVAIAASLPAPPAGQQSFQDVPTSSTFWQWIEGLASAGTIGGYACGGAGEPCVPPQSRPYFRPNNDVTRGQAAKIVSNTFFPNCQSNLLK